jgi:hypothetical protein
MLDIGDIKMNVLYLLVQNNRMELLIIRFVLNGIIIILLKKFFI